MQFERRINFIVTAFDVLTPITAHLKDDEKSLYSTKLKALHKRFYDPEFRLAVAGNFNCGKSTFLNALLRKRLLTTDILPTTAIPTYIRWNKEKLLKQTQHRHKELKYCNPIITLTMTDGRIYTLAGSEKIIFERETAIGLPDDTGAIIDTLTTTNRLIGKIAHVDLTFPERRGFENFCLIDTPGINPGDEESREHVLQTQRVLREDADAAILLYPAMNTMTHDTEEFMRDNAAHLMAGAIIILTKCDLVSKRELEKIVKYTTLLVKNRFNQEEPQIYTLSAQQAIDCFSGSGTDSADLQGANDFNRTLETIIGQLSNRRSEIVSRRISDLIQELIDSISKTIAEDLSALEEERILLKKASAAKLQEDFNELNRAYENYLSKKITQALQMIENELHFIIARRRERLFAEINVADSTAAINRCLNQNFPKIGGSVRSEILNRIKKLVISPINKSAQEYAKKLEECLTRCERYLGAINAQVVEIKNGQDFKISIVAPEAEKSFADKFADSFKDSVISVGINILAEAGGWITDKFRLNSQKKKAKDAATQKLAEFEPKFLEVCRANIIKICEENLTWAHNLLEEYKARYQEMFDDIERRHNERVNEVERKIIRNKKNIGRIEDLKELSAEM